MSKLDIAKEQIAYLKFWLGIMVVTGISLAGWLLSNLQSAHWVLIVFDLLALLTIGFGRYFIHKRIESKIAQTEEL